jgi:hydrogenase expression/formation protein HypE
MSEVDNGDPRGREEAVLEKIENFRRRPGRFRDEVVTLAHGAGGKATEALVDAIFRSTFDNEALSAMGDAAVLSVTGKDRVAFTTDSFVVNPIEFPGGSIGHLAVNGTVNDLAVSGARARWIAAAFVIEEGFEISLLKRIVADMETAAEEAGVQVVTGDTKVVERGSADGLFITTSGVGIIPAGRELRVNDIRPGDALVVSGTIGDHGMAVMLARGNLDLEADIRSDTVCVAPLVELLLDAVPETRWLRDPTRGGLGTICNELARSSGLGVLLEENALPVDASVEGACDLLGIDPLYVANEGKFLAVVPRKDSERAVEALRSHPLGKRSMVIGEIREDFKDVVVLRTKFGSTRIVDMLVGDPLPRIC